MKDRGFLVLGMILVCLGLTNAEAATRYVSNSGGHVEPFTSWDNAATNLNDAIAASSGGDLILVTNGEYSAQATFTVDRGVVIRSMNGRDATTLTGQGSRQVLSITHADARVEGFTITHGSAYNGGGLYISAGLVLDCVVSNNLASNSGGGIYQEYGGFLSNCLVACNSANLGGGIFTYFGGYAQDCTFSNNVAANRGGGLYAQMNGSLEDCAFIMNVSSNEGGGAYLYGSGMALTGCDVKDNRARNSGAGVYHYAGGSLYYCRVENNWLTSSGSGGGLYIKQSGSIYNSLVAGNNASNLAGGIYFDGGGLAQSCIISNNQSGTQGGGAYLYSGGRMTSCRIVNNRSSSGGGALFSSDGGQITDCLILRNKATSGGGLFSFFGGIARNCLLAHNVASNGMSGSGGGADLTYGGTLESCTVVDNFSQSWGGGIIRGADYPSTVMNSIVYFNLSSTSGSNYYASASLEYPFCATAPLPSGTGAIADDPLFVQRAEGDYRLQSGSPCVNSGTNQDWMTEAMDLSGTIPRIVQASTDMGAYEYASQNALAISGTPVAYGTSSPYDYGAHVIATPSNLALSVASPVAGAEGTRYVCTGWVGTGSAAAGGAGAEASFVLDEDSTLTWQWITQYEWEPIAQEGGSIGGADAGWYEAGTSLTVTAVPAAYFTFLSWTGDVPSEAVSSNPVTLVMDQAREGTALFDPMRTARGTPLYWLARHGWTQDFETVEALDQDGDTAPTWNEYVADTDPTNRQSRFLLHHSAFVGDLSTLEWTSATGRVYDVNGASNLLEETWQPLSENIAATPPLNRWTDQVERVGPYFYQIEVRIP